MKLPLKIDINSYGDVFILDNDNNYVTHVIKKENAEEIIKRVNEYEDLKYETETLKSISETRIKALRERNKEMSKLRMLNRELIEQLEIIKSTYEMGYVLNDTIIKDIEKVLKKIEGLDSIESKVSIDYHSKICSNCQYYYQGCKKNINSNNTICDKFKAFPF